MRRLALAFSLLAAPTFADEDVCAAGNNGITRAVRDGQDVRYAFCDGTTVTKHGDGRMSLTMSLEGADYEKFTEAARARMEEAEHLATAAPTPTAKKKAAEARAAFDQRVAEFTITHRWRQQRYFDAVKKSTVTIESARSALAP